MGCGMLALLLAAGAASGEVYLTPHHALLASSLDLGQATRGLALANASLAALEAASTVGGDSISQSARHLLSTVLRTGRFRLEGAGAAFLRLEGLAGARVRRGLSNPLYSVGEFAGWAFGLVTHDSFERFKSEVQGGLEELEASEAELEAAVAGNTEALEESLRQMDRFQAWMDKLLATNDKLIASEKFVLKIMRLKFELDTCLGSLESLGSILAEVLDRGDEGLASRYLFSHEHLSRQLLILNDRHPGLSPLYGARAPDRYFRLPLALSSASQATLRSVLRIPLIDPDSVFDREEQHFHDGFVRLDNFKYSALLTFPQHEACLSDTRGEDTICSLRPCLITPTGRADGFRCFALNSTNFLISRAGPDLKAECGGVVAALPGAGGRGYSHLALPLHCRAGSRHFTIKRVVAGSEALAADTAVLSGIYSIQPEAIVLNRTAGPRVSVRLETTAIIRHLNASLHHQAKARRPAPLPAHHLLPLAAAGGGLGSLALIGGVVLGVMILCRR